jgi:hypothetical protein
VYLLKNPKGDCLYGFEFQPGSNVVVRWRILEDGEGCRIEP